METRQINIPKILLQIKKALQTRKDLNLKDLAGFTTVPYTKLYRAKTKGYLNKTDYDTLLYELNQKFELEE